MAMDFTNVKATLVRVFMEGLLEANTDWQQIFNLYTDDQARLRLAGLTGIPNIPTWDGSAAVTTADMDSTGNIDMTYAGYGIQVQLNKYDIVDIPSLLPSATNKLARSVSSTFRSLAFAELAGAFTNVVADGKALCANDHPTAGATRDNLGTTGLDRGSFEAAWTQLREWVNFQDQPFDQTTLTRSMYLVVPPELESIARQIVGSPYAMTQGVVVDTSGPPPDGPTAYAPSQGEINVSLGRAQVIVSNELTDASDWFLVCGEGYSPLQFWTRGAPQYTVDVDQDTRITKLTVVFAAVAESGPQPDGIFGASVT